MITVMQLQMLLQQRFGINVECSINFEQITIQLAAHDLLEYCQALRDEPDFKFEQLIDLCVVDYLTYGLSSWETTDATSQGFSRGVDPINSAALAVQPAKNQQRFAVVYHLLSITHNQRVRLKCFASSEAPSLSSVVEIWPSANWYEREAYDLFGVEFKGHPDLRRILTDYEFQGHPFRKDFPLIGRVEARYDATLKRVVYEPVSIQPRVLEPKVIRHDNRYLCEQGESSRGK
jgi:NADH-quinone oxidoreductase subunit C